MVGGFNNNVQYKGKLFHVQTEGGGKNHPNVITHLFYEGNIVTTMRLNYYDILTADNLSELIKEIMETQHRNMMIALKKGKYDRLIERDYIDNIFDEIMLDI